MEEEITYRDGIKSALDRIEQDVSQITLQTQKTNGRVNRLENWRAYMIGFGACISVVMIPTLVLAIRIIYKT